MSIKMDVNYLLHRQQVSLIRAQSCPSRQGRAAYEGLAKGYSAKVDAYRRQNTRDMGASY